jgi:hypothetical protein
LDNRLEVVFENLWVIPLVSGELGVVGNERRLGRCVAKPLIVRDNWSEVVFGNSRGDTPPSFGSVGSFGRERRIGSARGVRSRMPRVTAVFVSKPETCRKASIQANFRWESHSSVARRVQPLTSTSCATACARSSRKWRFSGIPRPVRGFSRLPPSFAIC